MPILGGLLVSLFTGFASFLAGFLTRKVAIATAAVATLGTITAALLVAFRSLIVPLTAAMFDTEYGQLVGLFVPPIAGNCLAAFVATWAGTTLYAWQKRAVDVFVKA